MVEKNLSDSDSGDTRGFIFELDEERGHTHRPRTLTQRGDLRGGGLLSLTAIKMFLLFKLNHSRLQNHNPQSPNCISGSDIQAGSEGAVSEWAGSEGAAGLLSCRTPAGDHVLS